MYAHTMTIEELERRIGELRSDLRGYERAIEAMRRKRVRQDAEVSLMRSGSRSPNEALASNAVASVFRPIDAGSLIPKR